ncbi:cupin domain-containing protein, partial [Nocardia abscessus]|uniref:cupin domain-containing protein n=1 Tax=Nocardia abscessus TaxID=120957 RepID=UPI002453FEFD
MPPPPCAPTPAGAGPPSSSPTIVEGRPRSGAVGPGVRAALLCGAYELGRGRSHPILDELPEFIHLPARPGRHPALR